MAHRQLENLVRTGNLKTLEAPSSEWRSLIQSGDHRLQDARNESLNIESRFDPAYNAAHAFALAALRQHGYRATSRYIVFQYLRHTVHLPAEQWRVLDHAHRKRNLAEYEGEIDIDEQLLSALLRVTEEISARLNTNSVEP